MLKIIRDNLSSIDMSRVISQLLDAPEPDFSMAISELEHQAGNPSIDVHLTSIIQGTVHRKIRELGLDPSDTTANELYRGLQSMVRLHDQFLNKKLNIETDMSLSKQMSIIIKKIHSLPIPSKAWVIKSSSAKKLLKKNPPKKVKSALGYKSLDSMLKREKTEDILIYSRICETATWNKKFIKSYSGLTPADFETRKIKLKVVTNKKLSDKYSSFLQQKHHNNVVLVEHGIIGCLPLGVDKLPGLVITVLPLLLHNINEVRSYSAIFKMHQVHPDFSKKLVNILLNNSDDFVRLASQDVSWRIVQRHYGNRPHLPYPELFEPHIQADDLYWRKAESVIYWLEPALKFWEDLDYIAALYPDGPVPLSLMDNAVSYINKLEYKDHSRKYFKDSLWNELLLRYVGQDNFQQVLINQLDNKVFKTEMAEF